MRRRLYQPAEAIELLRKLNYVKFNPTVELHMQLGVDPRHADQMVRGTATLPAGTGKEVKVLVFAQGEKDNEARAAGADFVGLDDVIKQINEGWLGFDVAIATPDVMSKVASLGRRLGPRGLMPNPKAGTVTFDIGRAVQRGEGGSRGVPRGQDQPDPHSHRQALVHRRAIARQPLRRDRRDSAREAVGREGAVRQERGDLLDDVAQRPARSAARARNEVGVVSRRSPESNRRGHRDRRGDMESAQFNAWLKL